MSDLIERQAAIDTLDVGTELLRRVLDNADVVGVEREKFEWGLGLIESYISDMKELPSAQPEKRTEKRMETHTCDCISRAEAIELKPEFLNPNVNRETKEQTAIDRAYARGWNSCNTHWIKEIIEDLPSAQPERLTDYSFEESCTDCPAYDTENHRCPRFNQVIRGALKDANLEPCEDTISRQAAIDALADMHCKSDEDGYVWIIRSDAWARIDALPSAQPEPRWTPCSEGLPKEYVDVLVWFEYYRFGEYNRMYSTYGIGNYDEEYDKWWINHESGWRDLHVFAWMPLPEPYEKDDEEK